LSQTAYQNTTELPSASMSGAAGYNNTGVLYSFEENNS